VPVVTNDAWITVPSMLGGLQRVRAKMLVLCVVACALLRAGDVHAASTTSIGSIPPQLIQRVRDMSPEQQRRLAEQYGVDVDSLIGASSSRSLEELGRPGERLSPARPYVQRRDDDLLRFEGTKDEEEDTEEDEADSIKVRSLEPSERYGIGFFDSDVSSFEPVDNVPVPVDYRLGPGDSLNLLTIGNDNEEFEAIVDRDGTISFPRLGRLPVAGMTFGEASALIRARVAAQLIGVEVMVGVGRLRSINVILAGEVRVPGSRSMSALARVSHALFAAVG